MRRVLVLAYHFPPTGGAGVQRTVKFVRYLPELGYQPVVVTGPGAARGRWTPFDDTLLRELPVDVEIVRLRAPEPPPGSPGRQRAERWLGLESAFARWWVEGAVEAGRRLAEGIDLVYASMAPYETAVAAARLARELQRPWVADLRDPWALDEMLVYPTRLHRRRAIAGMGALLSAADAVVMNTAEAALRARRSFPELASKPLEAITNGFDAADFEGTAPRRDDTAFRIVHTGYLHTALGRRHRRSSLVRRALGGGAGPVDILTRSHVYLLRAVERVLASGAAPAGIEVHLAGALSAADRAETSGVVRMPGYLSHRQTIELVRSADLLFLPMHDLPAGTRATIVPGKTYEYLASGRPILAAVPDGDARDLLALAGTAFLCRPADVDGMAAALRALLAGARTEPPPAELLAPFERRALTVRLAALFDALLGGRTAQLPETATVPASESRPWS